eukprot:2319259-Pyramimonas_sp.AAC.1
MTQPEVFHVSLQIHQRLLLGFLGHRVPVVNHRHEDVGPRWPVLVVLALGLARFAVVDAVPGDLDDRSVVWEQEAGVVGADKLRQVATVAQSEPG